MKKAPPKKQTGVATGPRRLDGDDAMDVATFARELGDTVKGARSKISRGVVPYRRLGTRIIVLRSEWKEYLRALPGVTVDQAIANLKMRAGGQ